MHTERISCNIYPPASFTTQGSDGYTDIMSVYRESLSNSCLLVDRQVLRDNLAAIRAGLAPGTEIWPVLKGNAYGLGLAETARVLAGQPGVGALVVAHVSEGLALREAGIAGEILVWNCI